jgi:hypothetical protein
MVSESLCGRYYARCWGLNSELAFIPEPKKLTDYGGVIYMGK